MQDDMLLGDLRRSSASLIYFMHIVTKAASVRKTSGLHTQAGRSRIEEPSSSALVPRCGNGVACDGGLQWVVHE